VDVTHAASVREFEVWLRSIDADDGLHAQLLQLAETFLGVG